MKIFTALQIKEIDAFTIKNEPIADIDLMERAAHACSSRIMELFSVEKNIFVFAGKGNNGGDGLAIARHLAGKNYNVEVFLYSDTFCHSTLVNLNRLKKQNKVKLSFIKHESDFPEIQTTDIIIDALFGSGLSRPVEGIASEIIQFLNAQKSTVISIDIPSGFFTEDNSLLLYDENLNYYTQAVKADFTLTLELPFLSFMFPDSEKNVGKLEILSIGLHKEIINKTNTTNYFADKKMISLLIKKRQKFSHKGTFGHALFISGSFGKMGAAILGSRAALRTGLGLLTTHVPRLGYEIMQNTVPEAMISIDQSEILISDIPEIESISAIGMGPATGQKENTRKALCKLFKINNIPLVLDADALNIMAKNKEMLSKVPENTILTPHPKEFERLFGKEKNMYQRHLKIKELSRKYKVVIVLKGAYTGVYAPNGTCVFNSTGNNGMATAGSGDVLTGIILSLLAQGYVPDKAAILGVYLHGLAGDLALTAQSHESLIASDIVNNLGKAFKQIKDNSVN